MTKKSSSIVRKKSSAALKKTEATKKSVAPAKKPTPAKKAETIAPYRQVRMAIEKGGPEAGLKHGIKIGLPESQARAYVKELVVILERLKRKAEGLDPPIKRPEGSPQFEPDFRFNTREAALKHLLATARRIGAQDKAFHILTEAGKYAVVPAHIRPEGKLPQFRKGDLVMDTIVADSRAKIVEAGPEQSVVRYVEDRKYAPKEQIIHNIYLYKIDDMKDSAIPPAKAKAAKPAPAALSPKKATVKKKKAANG